MALRSPAFRRLWCSSLASTASQSMERTTTAWLALQVGGGAFAIGMIFAARMLPSLLFGLAAGTIADRANRTHQLLAVAVAALVLIASFGWIVSLGGLRVWHVVVFAFVAGCVQVFDTPARQALVLDTVPREAAANALALTALASRFASAAGAIGAGAVISLAGVARAYTVIVGAFGLAAVLLATLRVPQEHRALVALPPFSQSFRDAARLIIDLPTVRTLMVAGVVCEIFAFSYLSALPLFAQDVLKVGAEGLGTLNAAAAIGGAIAVALLALLPGSVKRQPVLGAIFLAYGMSLLSLAVMRNLLGAAAVMLVIGCCAGAFDVLQQTLIQLAVPDQQRGRAVGLWVLSIGSGPVGHLEMGTLIATLGVPAALLINGGVTVAAAAMLLWRVPTYRWAWGTKPKALQ
jgi:MFS family permease